VNVSDEGLRFIAGFEGLSLRLYNDDGLPSATSKGNATIGVGHLVHYGPVDGRPEEAPYAAGITEEQAYALLREDVRRFEAFILSQAKVPLTQNQFDALVDFSFNTGGGYPEVWRAVNNGGDVCEVLVRTAITPSWATAGLVRRRRAECALYNRGEEAGVTQQQYDELKADIGAVLRQLGVLGEKIDKQGAELLAQSWLAASGRADELKRRVQYEAAATGVTLP